jgi:predicted RNA methylase
MLLAFASLVPPWAFSIGAVEIYAVDIDARAIRMYRINCLSYGCLPGCTRATR